MTRNKNFKRLVRARMLHTGASYTLARSALARSAPAPHPPPPHPANAEEVRQQQVVVERWFFEGRLRSIPARRKVRAAVLLQVLTRFVPGRTYDEFDVSRLLEAVHPDFAYLRRELVSLGYLDRHLGTYSVCREPPVRTAQQRRELPRWEEVWLPGYLGSAHPSQPATEAP